MPIRFRCVYCDKLLGIARRKAGAVVNCPQCGQALIVPSPQEDNLPTPSFSPSATPRPSPSQNPVVVAPPPQPVQPVPASGSPPVKAPPPVATVFEADDFNIYVGDQNKTVAEPPPSAPLIPSAALPAGPNISVPRATMALAMEDSVYDVELIPRKGVFLSRWKLLFLVLMFFVVIGGSFAAGMFFGKKSAEQNLLKPTETKMAE